MSLLKVEKICTSCNTHFILVLKPVDLPNLSCCPFCSYPIEVELEDEEQDETDE